MIWSNNDDLLLVQQKNSQNGVNTCHNGKNTQRNRACQQAKKMCKLNECQVYVA